MKQPIRLLLIVLNSLLAITAVAGGAGLLSGMNAPTVDMLTNSPFNSYIIPGLALLMLVGGTASAAAIMLIRAHRYALRTACIAGIMIVIFETVEVAVIGSPEGIARNLQLFYFALGFVITGIAWRGAFVERLLSASK